MHLVPEFHCPELAEVRDRLAVIEERMETLLAYTQRGTIDIMQQLSDLRGLATLNVQGTARLIDLEEAQMADLSALTTEVSENGDVIDSAVTLLGSLSQQIRDLSTDPAALQALADSLDAQTNELAGAIAANTPAEPETGGTPDELPSEPIG